MKSKFLDVASIYYYSYVMHTCCLEWLLSPSSDLQTNQPTAHLQMNQNLGTLKWDMWKGGGRGGGGHGERDSYFNINSRNFEPLPQPPLTRTSKKDIAITVFAHVIFIQNRRKDGGLRTIKMLVVGMLFLCTHTLGGVGWNHLQQLNKQLLEHLSL